jgi:DNA invertase Pin-like site-specific DNA recombinase
MKTAAIYARYSSDRQTEQSIERQLRACNDYADRNGIVVVDTYIDRAMTGKNDKRAEFQRMLKDSAKRAWNCVLIYRTDRFGRNKYELAMNKHTLKQNGIRLISVMENIPETPEGIILESLLEGMAEYYSAELSQKIRRGNIESRKKGNVTGGKMPYGYKIENKKAVIVPEKAEIIRYIYEQYAKNVTIKNIIKSLTDKGIFYNGNPFAKNTVHGILQNSKYAGIYKYGDEIYTNIYPQIVPDELFKIVQTKNENNRYGSLSKYVRYILRKKVICGYCGSTIHGVSSTARSGEKKHYYRCPNNYIKKICNKQSVRKDDLENVVIQAIMTLFDNDNMIENFANKIIEVNAKRLKDQSILKILQGEQDKIIKAKHNIIVAIEQGIITASTKERLQELELQQEELSTKIMIEESKVKTTIKKDDIIEFIKKALNNNAERIIDLLVKQIILYDDKLIIKCNYSDKLDSEYLDKSVLSSIAELNCISKNTPLQTKEIELNIKV